MLCLLNLAVVTLLELKIVKILNNITNFLSIVDMHEYMLSNGWRELTEA